MATPVTRTSRTARGARTPSRNTTTGWMRAALVGAALAALTLTAPGPGPALADDGVSEAPWAGDRGLVADQEMGFVSPGEPGAETSPVVTGQTVLPPAQVAAEVHPRPADGVYDISGGGFGHGIGMSQYGAHGAALQGLTHGGILAFYYPGTSLVPSAPESLTVGITVDNDGVLTVAARSGLTVTIAGTSATLPAGPTRWRVRATGGTVNTCSLDAYQGAWTTYRSGTICPVRFSAPSGTVDLVLPTDQRIYRGAISAVWRSSSVVRTVNDVPMQAYLRSVVPSEMPSSWAAAALRAQSVAARTYAARGSNGTSWYDTCDTTACQVYRGLGRRNADGTFTSYESASTDAAVTATDRQVLTFRFSDGVTRLATTMYSSSNGGFTAAAGNGHTYLTGRADPYDAVAINRRHSWTAALPVSALEARFGIHRVERVQVLSRDGRGSWGGRVLDVRVEGLTTAGAYTYVNTTGTGLMAARSWPAWSTGLSSNYFTFLPESASVTRIGGTDRYAVAANLSKEYPVGTSVVYVATGATFPDALAGAARAAYNGGPVLLTQPSTLPAATRAAMERLRPGRVVVLGGTASVSPAVAEQLRTLTTSGGLQRVGGADRYAVAANLAAYYPAGGVAYVASGAVFADALSGTALAGRDRAPILLTQSDYVPAATARALDRLAPSRIVVLGGEGTVSPQVAAALASHTSGTVTRIGGRDRYEVAANVARRFASASRVFVASGLVFGDGLAGGARAGRLAVPVLLSRTDTLPGSAATEINRLDPATATILGGTGSVSSAVEQSVKGLVP